MVIYEPPRISEWYQVSAIAIDLNLEMSRDTIHLSIFTTRRVSGSIPKLKLCCVNEYADGKRLSSESNLIGSALLLIISLPVYC